MATENFTKIIFENDLAFFFNFQATLFMTSLSAIVNKDYVINLSITMTITIDDNLIRKYQTLCNLVSLLEINS